MSKADRVIYGESSMNHAMVFTGVSFDVSIRPDGVPFESLLSGRG